nr:MAG TPA: hypothetical protein [Caudoviricetes sp.]
MINSMAAEVRLVYLFSKRKSSILFNNSSSQTTVKRGLLEGITYHS